jgi:exosortase/archaeosortase family protein
LKPLRYKLQVPRVVALFFLKALLVFVVWKAVYLLWLMPKGILDEPLTWSTGKATVGMLNLFWGHGRFVGVRGFETQEVDGGEVTGAVTDVILDGQNTLRIAGACNGLELMVLYVAFLFCYPGERKRRWRFALGGLCLIFLLNILRCSLLVWIFVRYRQYLDFSHHFFFTFLVYACIFLLWWRYTLKPYARSSAE